MTSPVPRLTPEQQGTVKRARALAEALRSGDEDAMRALFTLPPADGSLADIANVYAHVTGRTASLMPALLDIITELAGEQDG
jgi:hypothetical protein